MRILQSFIVVPLVSVAAMMTLATVFIPQAMSLNNIKDGPIWFGAPLHFIAQDFSSMDPPAGYVMHNGLSSPWEYPIQKFVFIAFILDILLLSAPIFIPLILAEILLRMKMVRKGT